MTAHEYKPLTSAEIQELGDMLRKRKSDLTTSRAAHLVRARSTGEAVAEDADRAQQGIEAEENNSRADGERAELQRIDEALAKIAEGTYGVSEESGENIGVGRLRALPTARFTVNEQEMIDRNK